MKLTDRELEIAKLLAAGKTNKEVAIVLGLSTKTVETHRVNTYLRLGVHNIVELTHYAIAQGWVPLLYAAPEKP